MKVSSIVLFLLLAAMSTFAQELPGGKTASGYLNKVKAEGYELVEHGSFSQGELPKSIFLELERYYKYQIFAIPSGKLKAITVSIGYFRMSSSKADPVFDWIHVAKRSGKTEFKFMNTKKRGRFTLSPENSLYYIIAKKPI